MVPLIVMGVVFEVDSVRSGIFVFLALCTGLVGAINGVLQTTFRGVMAHSSLVHLGWILIVLPFRVRCMVVYWVGYTIFLLPPAVLFMWVGLNSVKHLGVLASVGGRRMCYLFSGLMLRLGGLPPFSGFLFKVMVISKLSEFGVGPLVAGIFLAVFRAYALRFYCNIAFERMYIGVKRRVQVNEGLPLFVSICAALSLIGGYVFYFITPWFWWV